jgi:hypothetical protein
MRQVDHRGLISFPFFERSGSVHAARLKTARSALPALHLRPAETIPSGHRRDVPSTVPGSYPAPQLGVHVLEAVEPGTPLDLSATYPVADSVVELLSSLHESGVLDPSCPTVGRRVAYCSTPRPRSATVTRN